MLLLLLLLIMMMTSLQAQYQRDAVSTTTVISSVFITWSLPWQRRLRHRHCLATLVTSSCTSLTSTTTVPCSTFRRLATTLFTLATSTGQVNRCLISRIILWYCVCVTWAWRCRSEVSVYKQIARAMIVRQCAVFGCSNVELLNC